MLKIQKTLTSRALRKSEHNLFNALQYNSNQYVQYKQQLVKTVNDTEWERRFDPSYILDTALEQIVSAKSENDLLNIVFLGARGAQWLYVSSASACKKTIPFFGHPCRHANKSYALLATAKYVIAT